MKKFISLLLVLTLFFTMSVSICGVGTSTYAGTHKTPSGADCNNTVYGYTDTGELVNVVTGYHTTVDGRTCYVTQPVYKHNLVCTCGTIVGTYNKGCIESHSLCGKYVAGNCAP